MNIIPDSSIWFCRDVEIQQSDQIDFNSIEEQRSYFESKVVATQLKCYYIRQDNRWQGQVKVALPYATLYNCDYLFYNNTGFLNKYFYAYIDNVEYVDTNTTRVNFTVDHYQTWLLDYEVKFAETVRQTVQSSEQLIRNKYIYPDVDVGGVYKSVTTQTIDLSNNMCILLFGSSSNFVAELIMNIDFQASQGQFYPGVIFVYRMSDPDRYKKLKEDLYSFAQVLKFDKCVMMPNIGGMLDTENCWPQGTEVTKDILQSGEVLKQQTDPVYQTFNFNLNIPQKYKADLKILQEPYIKYSLQTSGGNSLDNVNIGLINSNQAQSIKVTAVPLLWPEPMIVLYLYDYAGISEVQDTQLPEYLKFNRQTRLVVRDFPNIQTNEVDLSSIASSMIGLAGGLVGGLAGGLGHLAQASAMNLISNENSKRLGETTEQYNERVSAMNNSVNSSRQAAREYLGDTAKKSGVDIVNYLGYVAQSSMQQKSISQAQIWQQTFRFTISFTQYILSNIDVAYEVFRRYGYQYIGFECDTKQRPYWNYVRTQRCEIAGPIPEEAKTYIQDMYNSGVTFWHDSDIYNYDRDNF